MKKTVAFLLLLSLLFALCACGHEHTWEAATCSAPKTCSGCGATEGDPLGHEWAEATCTTPKTCKRCGETEGEPLGHQWTEASYSAPATCTICGETTGDKKLSFFEENNVQVADKLRNLSIKAVAVDRENNPSRIEFPATKIVIKSNALSPSAERAGYSRHTIVYELSCIAPTFAEGYGVDMGNICDYYTGYVFEDRTTYGSEIVELHDDVTIDGTKYTLYYSKNVDWGEWEWSSADNAPVSHVTVTYQIDVPDDYDGLVLLFADQTEWIPYEENDSITSYTLSRSDLDNKHFFHIQ